MTTQRTSLKRQKRRRILQRRAMRGLSLLLIFLAGVVGYSLANSTWFNLTEVIVEGNQVIAKDNLIELVNLRLGTNILKISPKTIANKVSSHPFVKSVDVKRQYPNKIRVIIVERSPIILATNGLQNLALDEEGYCIEKFSIIGANKSTLTRVIVGDSIIGLEPGSQTDDTGLLAALELIKNLDPFFKENILEFHAYTEWDLALITRDGLPVYFGPPDNLPEKLQYYEEILIKNSAECNANTLEYVDLRFDSQPVIKRKNLN